MKKNIKDLSQMKAMEQLFTYRPFVDSFGHPDNSDMN